MTVNYELSKEKNLFLATEPYVIQKSREEGEKDLEILVDTEEGEGCWVFFHKFDAWVNILASKTVKHEEERGEISETVYSAQCYRMNLKPNFLPATHYHTHPALDMAEHFESLPSIVRKIYDSDKDVKKLWKFQDALPSSKDVQLYLDWLKDNMFAKEIDFKIAHKNGVTIFTQDNLAYRSPKATVERYQFFLDNIMQPDSLKMIKHPQLLFQIANKYMDGYFNLTMEPRK